MARTGGDAIQTTSSSSSTGTLALDATATDALHLPFPASFDGQLVSFRVDHSTIQSEFEIVEGVYTHSGRTLTRPAANVTHGTDGPGANVDFSTGGLIVSVVGRWQDIVDARHFTTTAIKTGAYTAVRGDEVLTNTSGGAFTVTLPASPVLGSRVAMIDTTNMWPSNNLTIGRNGSTIEGLTEDCAAIGGRRVELLYDGVTWRFQFEGAGGLSPGGGLTPFADATGSQAAAAHGRKWKLTGNVTAVPIANGWEALYVNVSGSARTVTPASGVCVVVEAGATAASVSVANNKSIVAMGDGTNLIVMGDVV